MGWGIAFRLRPAEEIIDASMEAEKGLIKPVYSVILTNQRILFNFNPMSSPRLGTSLLWNSLDYNEISKVDVVSRLFIKYLKIVTPKRHYYLNVHDPEYWAKRIKEIFPNTLQ